MRNEIWYHGFLITHKQYDLISNDCKYQLLIRKLTIAERLKDTIDRFCEKNSITTEIKERVEELIKNYDNKL